MENKRSYRKSSQIWSRGFVPLPRRSGAECNGLASRQNLSSRRLGFGTSYAGPAIGAPLDDDHYNTVRKKKDLAPAPLNFVSIRRNIAGGRFFEQSAAGPLS